MHKTILETRKDPIHKTILRSETFFYKLNIKTYYIHTEELKMKNYNNASNSIEKPDRKTLQVSRSIVP